MRIASLHIKGFRNFIDEVINFDEKTLIIGGNDTGKTNLLYALRILFDPSLSQKDLELGESDFCIYTSSNLIEITAQLGDINEDCVNSALKGAVENGSALIRYTIQKGGDFEFLIGHTLDTLSPCHGRVYIKNLAMEYVGGGRDLSVFLRRQQNRLLEIARDQRDDGQKVEDDAAISQIQSNLAKLNDSISSLHYVADSLASVNAEMAALSVGNEGYTARFVAGNTDAKKLLDNLRLAYLRGDSPLVFGGDGRSNQLYFATWIAEQQLPRHQERAVFYAIEEPEAHLHPHQQRQLAEYLFSVMSGQVLITTHSPQIVDRFRQGRILRLTNDSERRGNRVLGCSAALDEALDKLGYRLSAISAETFFSNGVLLVEGPSERMLYIALANALGKDIDRLNISILSVDGVGFTPYVRVCKELGIPFALRTDNDIFRIGNTDRWRAAGVQRLIGIAKEHMGEEVSGELDLTHESFLAWSGSESPTTEAEEAFEMLMSELSAHGFFLSEHADLEDDLANGPLAGWLMELFEKDTPQKARKAMQRRKAENMLRFIRSNPDLRKLAGEPISEPLKFIVAKVESQTS